MAVFDPETRRIVLRIVYDGPGYAGKTTNLRALERFFTRSRRGELHAPGEVDGRTRFFDWMHLDGGLVQGYPLRCQLLTVPGQRMLRGRRARLLESADAVVFVCASTELGVQHAWRMLDVMRARGVGTDGPEGPPMIVQANKQDLPHVLGLEQVRARLGVPDEVVVQPARAAEGIGVRETLVLAIRAAADRVQRQLTAHGLGAIEGVPARPEEILEELRQLPEDAGADVVTVALPRPVTQSAPAPSEDADTPREDTDAPPAPREDAAERPAARSAPGPREDADTPREDAETPREDADAPPGERPAAHSAPAPQEGAAAPPGERPAARSAPGPREDAAAPPGERPVSDVPRGAWSAAPAKPRAADAAPVPRGAWAEAPLAWPAGSGPASSAPPPAPETPRAEPEPEDAPLPPWPDPDAASGLIWPAVRGRERLRSLRSFGAPTLRTDLRGRHGRDDGSGSSDLFLFELEGLCLKTSSRRRFGNVDEARQALLDLARRKASLGSLLVPDTVLCVSVEPGGAAWLWTVTPWLTTLRARMEAAAARGDEDALGDGLVDFADAAVEALLLAVRRSVVIDLHPSNFAVHHGSLRYLDDDIAAGDVLGSIGHAIARRAQEYGAHPHAVERYLEGLRRAFVRLAPEQRARALLRDALGALPGRTAETSRVAERILGALDGSRAR